MGPSLSPHLNETRDWTFPWVPSLPCSFAPMFVSCLLKYLILSFYNKLDVPERCIGHFVFLPLHRTGAVHSAVGEACSDVGELPTGTSVVLEKASTQVSRRVPGTETSVSEAGRGFHCHAADGLGVYDLSRSHLSWPLGFAHFPLCWRHSQVGFPCI